MDVRQLYNQAWDSSSCSWSQMGNKMPAWESACRLRALGPQWPTVKQPNQNTKKCCYGQKNLRSICSSLSLSPTHLSHTRNINPFENKVWGVYFYKEVCSFVHWSSSLLFDYVPHVYVLWLYNISNNTQPQYRNLIDFHTKKKMLIFSTNYRLEKL